MTTTRLYEEDARRAGKKFLRRIEKGGQE